MTFLTEEEIIKLFENDFQIVCFKGFEKDGKTGIGTVKHWHIYNVIAKKMQNDIL